MKKATVIKITRNIMGTASITMQLEGMRKPQGFTVYPIPAGTPENNPIKIQSDTRMGQIDLSTGKGKISQPHPNGAYFHHLVIDKLVEFELSNVDAQSLRMQIFVTADDKAGIKTGIFTDNSGAIRVL